MIILKPFTSVRDLDNPYTTHLHFEGPAIKPFYMRGAIAWPEGKKEGFALMAGMDLRERIIIIFEEFRFWTIPHWFNDDGTIHARDDGEGYHIGLIEFLQDNLSKYKAASYFLGGQHVDVQTRWRTDVYRNPEVTRRLEMIEVPYVSEIGDELLLEKLKTRKFKGATDSLLDKSVRQFNNMQTTNVEHDNAVLALKSLLAGFEHQPWVEIRGE